MFTQCSKCETVFRLSADVLRAAGGQVRCGRCGEVFNALQRLAEDATAFSKGESSYELENRADAILNSAEAVAPAEPEFDETQDSDVEVAQLRIVDPVNPVDPVDPVDPDGSVDVDPDRSVGPGDAGGPGRPGMEPTPPRSPPGRPGILDIATPISTFFDLRHRRQRVLT